MDINKLEHDTRCNMTTTLTRHDNYNPFSVTMKIMSIKEQLSLNMMRDVLRMQAVIFMGVLARFRVLF